jgi:hypothetical protein
MNLKAPNAVTALSLRLCVKYPQARRRDCSDLAKLAFFATQMKNCFAIGEFVKKTRVSSKAGCLVGGGKLTRLERPFRLRWPRDMKPFERTARIDVS